MYLVLLSLCTILIFDFSIVKVIQIDEAALREGLPLRKSEHAFYLDWAVHSFRITNCGVQDTTQVCCCNPQFFFPKSLLSVNFYLQ